MKTPKILLLVLVLVLFSSAYAFAAKVSLPSKNGDAGTAVEIPINIDNATGLAAYQITITYDKAVLTCTKVEKGFLTQGWDTPTANTTVAGKITFLSTDPNLQELSKGSGSLAVLKCTAAGNPGKRTALRTTDVLLSDGKGTPISATPVDGTFRINAR
jgi:hypothetical protein